MRKIFLCCVLLSGFLILLVNLTYGTYLLGYESTLNALTTGECNSAGSFRFLFTTWFYIFPIFSLSMLFNSTYAYCWIITILNVIIFSSLLCSLYILLKRGGVGLVLAITALLIFTGIYFENIVLVGNHSISFFSIIAGYLLVFLIKKSAISRLNYIPAILLTVIGFISRLEIGVLTLLVLLAYNIIFQRQTLRFSVVFFLASLSVFAFYRACEHKFHPEEETIWQTERVFQDRNAIVPAEAKDYKTQLILTAIKRCIRDDDIVPLPVYSKIVFSQSLADYVRSDKFPGIYIGKLEELGSLLKNYFWLLILTAVLATYTLRIYLKYKENYFGARLRVCAFVLFVIVLILVLNAILLVPTDFIVDLWIALNILCLVYLIQKVNEDKSIFAFWFVFLVAFEVPLTGYHLCSLYKYEERESVKAQAFRTMLANLDVHKKIIVFAWGATEEDYPAKLFSGLYKTKINQYYADSYLERHPLLTEHNEQFFGNGYANMKSKIDSITNHENVVYVSSESYNKFIAEYMRVFYKVKLNFHALQTGKICDQVQAYSVAATPMDD